MKLKKIIKAFYFPIIIFLIQIFILEPLKIYDIYPWFDIPMHLLGGLVISNTYFLILSALNDENKIKLTKPILFIFIISLVALTALFWEFYEFSLDQLIQTSKQGNLKDTISDLLLGLLGGSLGATIKVNSYKDKRSK